MCGVRSYAYKKWLEMNLIAASAIYQHQMNLKEMKNHRGE